MLNAEMQAQFDRQTRDLYEAIGRFAVQYEHMVFALQTGVELVLQYSGLSNQSLARAVTAGLTAEPLRAMWLAVMMEGYASSDFDKKVLSSISNQAGKEIELRNDTLHRVWFVGWGNETTKDFSNALTLKFKNTKAGVTNVSREQSATELKESALRIADVASLINRASGCALMKSKLERNFILDGGRAVAAVDGQRLPRSSNE